MKPLDQPVIGIERFDAHRESPGFRFAGIVRRLLASSLAVFMVGKSHHPAPKSTNSTPKSRNRRFCACPLIGYLIPSFHPGAIAFPFAEARNSSDPPDVNKPSCDALVIFGVTSLTSSSDACLSRPFPPAQFATAIPKRLGG